MSINRILAAVLWLSLLGLVVLFGARVLGNVGSRAAAAV